MTTRDDEPGSPAGSPGGSGSAVGGPSPLRPGRTAPDLALPRGPGDVVRLSEHAAGRPTLVLFFPLAFSPVCTEELCAVAEDLERWTDVDAAVVAVSVDSPFTVRRFAEETGVPYPVLSDFNREAVTAFGVRDDDYFGLRGVAYRSAFVLDAGLRVVWSWATADDAVLPDLEEVREAVRRAAL
ncbi:MAG: redoxin domain-containing protein [Gemmatimonadetes bacterium]|nr:redoxin domain-containing protein [Gemmatimonadota bacterium]